MMTIARTKTGQIDLVNPRPEDIQLGDIAYSLARIVRYNGHCPGWNVALHSIEVAKRCRRYQLEGLMHDAAETYIGDVIRPLKRLLGGRLAAIEREIEKAVAKKFCLTYPWPQEVIEADHELCRLEMEQFWPESKVPQVFWPLSAALSEAAFKTAFRHLSKGR